MEPRIQYAKTKDGVKCFARRQWMFLRRRSDKVYVLKKMTLAEPPQPASSEPHRQTGQRTNTGCRENTGSTGHARVGVLLATGGQGQS